MVNPVAVTALLLFIWFERRTVLIAYLLSKIVWSCCVQNIPFQISLVGFSGVGFYDLCL